MRWSSILATRSSRLGLRIVLGAVGMAAWTDRFPWSYLNVFWASLQYANGGMTPPRFSWIETLRALGRPSPPPPGLVRAGTLLLAFCLTAVLILVSLGYVWHDNPHRYFGERKAGTYLSFLNLLATGAVSASIARHLGPAPFARFWWAAAGGFVWLGCDDLFTIHEQIDRGVHALLGLDPEDPMTDHLDDLIVAGYGVAALGLAYRYRADLQYVTWMHRTLGGAFMLFATMVVIDFLHWSKTLEDSLKVVAGTLIIVGFHAARLELRENSRPYDPDQELRTRI